MRNSSEHTPASYSEAIRLGAMLGPQAFGRLWDEQGGTCANGAAMEALGRMRVDRTGPVAEASFFEHGIPFRISLERARCPEGCEHSPVWTLSHVVIHLNNYHRWPRERIADFVESIEQAHAGLAEQPSTELALTTA